METLKFKTTIKCSGCVETVTPYLNAAVGENNWEVDTINKEKILTISHNATTGTSTIVKAVQDAGYKAELITN